MCEVSGQAGCRLAGPRWPHSCLVVGRNGVTRLHVSQAGLVMMFQEAQCAHLSKSLPVSHLFTFIRESPMVSQTSGTGDWTCFFTGRQGYCGHLHSVPSINHKVMAGEFNERKNANGRTQSLAHSVSWSSSPTTLHELFIEGGRHLLHRTYVSG